MTALRLVLADDSVLFREGLATLLTSRGFTVVAQVGDGEAAVQAVADHHPAVALLDIRMPPSGTDEGLRAATRIGKLHPDVAVVVLSEYLEPVYATRLLEADAPGRGYLLKGSVTDLDTVVDAVRRVAAGESVVDRAIVKQVLRRLRSPDPLDALSEREREILALMAEGRSNRGIADRLAVSERTVESHIAAVFGKLAVPLSPDDHRRVLAVLAYLRGGGLA